MLTPDGIREFLADLAEDGETYILKHVTYSLKSFLETVLKPRDPALFRALYDTFTVYKPKSNNKATLPTLEQLCLIWQNLPTIESRFYFALLAETGLRPGEPFLVSIEGLDLERGMIRIAKITETKRAFIAFIRPEFLEWIRTNYLPRRDSFVKAFIERVGRDYLGVGVNAEAWARRLIPFDQGRLRKEVKDVARGVLGRDFELYELRKFLQLTC